jgi:hypothetical protein
MLSPRQAAKSRHRRHLSMDHIGYPLQHATALLIQRLGCVTYASSYNLINTVTFLSSRYFSSSSTPLFVPWKLKLTTYPWHHASQKSYPKHQAWALRRFCCTTYRLLSPPTFHQPSTLTRNPAEMICNIHRIAANLILGRVRTGFSSAINDSSTSSLRPDTP